MLKALFSSGVSKTFLYKSSKCKILCKMPFQCHLLYFEFRSVWEESGKKQQDGEGTSSNTLSLQVPVANQKSQLCGSQDSIYHDCWSVAPLTHDADESVTKTTTNQEIIVSSSFNGGWSKKYDSHVTQASQRSIWSPAIPPTTTVDSVSVSVCVFYLCAEVLVTQWLVYVSFISVTEVLVTQWLVYVSFLCD